MNETEKIKIIVVGKCNASSNYIRDKTQSILNIIFVDCPTVDQLYQTIETYNHVAAIIICCSSNLTEEREFSIINTVRTKYPTIPMMGVTDILPTKEHLQKCYDCGIMEHMTKPKDDFEININCNKLKILIDLYKFRIGLEDKIKEIVKYQGIITDVMKKYISLLAVTHTAYLILDENCKILDANIEFLKLIDCENLNDIIGCNPSEWIASGDLEQFKKSWNEMTCGHEVDDLQIRMLPPCKNTPRAVWIRIRGNCFFEETKKVVWIIKDISEKKTKDEIDRIQDAKKRDAIRQNILSIQSNLSPVLDEEDSETK